MSITKTGGWHGPGRRQTDPGDISSDGKHAMQYNWRS